MAWFPFYPFLNSFRSPCCPSLLPFVLPFTYLAPSSCDRNRPPSSQVACKLTLFAPPFTQLFRPSQPLRTPIAQRLTTTTLGLLRSHYAEHSPIRTLLSRADVHKGPAMCPSTLSSRFM